MTAFFVNVLIAVLKNADVQAMLRILVAEAIDKLGGELMARFDQLEHNVLDRVEKLPGEILGDASKDVGILLREITGTTDQIAGAVKGQVSPLLDPGGFARAIVGQMFPGGQKPPWFPL